MTKKKEEETKSIKVDKCPNCNGKGFFEDEGKKKTCPCQALEG